LHPYYWAGVITIGNMEALDKSSKMLSPLFLILGLFIALFVIFNMLSKRRT